MSDNLEVWSRQLYGIAALVICLDGKLSDDPPKHLIKEALYGIKTHINLIASEMEEIGLAIRQEENAE